MGSRAGLFSPNHRRQRRVRFRDVVRAALKVKEQFAVRTSTNIHRQGADPGPEQSGLNIALEVIRNRAIEPTRFEVYFESDHSDGGIRPLRAVTPNQPCSSGGIPTRRR